MRTLKTHRTFIYCLAWAFIFFSASAFALEVPPPPSDYVYDSAQLLDASSRQKLSQKLAEFEKITSNQILVATFPSLEGGSLEDFSIRLAERWKPGQKDRNNGAILLIMRDDRRVRIETGYGLEGALTDALSKSIIENEIIPRFKQGNFQGGITAGVDALLQATQGEYQAEGSRSGGGRFPRN